MRTVYINGEWHPEDEAKVSIFDRGLLFAQSVYEVVPVIAGKPINWQYHSARLAKSLELARIADATDWPMVFGEIIERNALEEGRIYLQVTGGAAMDRDFCAPDPAPAATTIAFTQVAAVLANPVAETGLRVVLVPEGRWQMRSAKTTQLLYAVLMKEAAHDAGVDDAWLVEDGHITEATSANAHIIDSRGVLVSHPVDHGVLPGVTRINVIEIAREMGLEIEERPFTPDELFAAREAFISSASALVLPVVEVDGRQIGNGGPGVVTADLRQRYIARLTA